MPAEQVGLYARKPSTPCLHGAVEMSEQQKLSELELGLIVRRQSYELTSISTTHPQIKKENRKM